MKLMTGLAILLKAWTDRLRQPAARPADVLDDALEQLANAAQEVKLRLAELIVIRNRTARQLKELQSQGTSNPELVHLLENQLASQSERISRLRTETTTMEHKVLFLQAHKSDLEARTSILQAQENIQHLLWDLNATTLEGALAGIENDLAQREEVLKVLQQLNGGSASRPFLPGQGPGTLPS